jgi:hypothetical protein
MGTGSSAFKMTLHCRGAVADCLDGVGQPTRQMSMLYAKSSSSTFRSDKGKRTYIITTWRIILGGELK